MEAGYEFCIYGHDREEHQYLVGRYTRKTCRKCACPDFRRR